MWVIDILHLKTKTDTKLSVLSCIQTCLQIYPLKNLKLRKASNLLVSQLLLMKTAIHVGLTLWLQEVDSGNIERVKLVNTFTH